MQETLNQLIQYALDHQMIDPEETDYCANKLIDLFQEPAFEKMDAPAPALPVIMNSLLDEAVARKMIEDTTTERDLLDARIMDIVMPRPAEVNRRFAQLYAQDPEKATDWFYDLSIRSNYIHKDRTDKNIRFERNTKYGPMQITINLSKPEKDPREIAAARNRKSTGYPACLLCRENVGFAGHANHPARQNHRIIPLDLGGDRYYMQYSPYIYYNEHCIVFNEKHIPMRVDHDTFEHLADFVDLFEHYTLGSNTDIPIVGGSILTHDHYQGGRHHFPIEDAKVRHHTEIDGVSVDLLNWPLTTLRLHTDDRQTLVALADRVLAEWIAWEDPENDILRETDGVRHNAITPILRKKEGVYELDLVLRNNRTTKEYPLGIFHPHAEHHHVKKENIGLIEVMGLAILPARLKDEMALIRQVLAHQLDVNDDPRLEKHAQWIGELKLQWTGTTDLDDFLEQALTDKFVKVLENAGVYKTDEKGLEGALRFLEQVKRDKD